MAIFYAGNIANGVNQCASRCALESFFSSRIREARSPIIMEALFHVGKFCGKHKLIVDGMKTPVAELGITADYPGSTRRNRTSCARHKQGAPSQFTGGNLLGQRAPEGMAHRTTANLSAFRK